MEDNKNLNQSQSHCCCCGGKSEAPERSAEKKSCCSSAADENFLKLLDEESRTLILDPSTAPELISSGEEVFAAYQNQKLSPWARGLWELHKEVINSTIEGGWGNDVHPWDRGIQDFWKYPIAFSAYGIPSLVMTEPGLYEEACDILRKQVLLMKDAGAYDEWTRLEFGKDPVTDKNVMYKGHLMLMYGLYQLLSGSDEFEVEYQNLSHMIVTEAKRNARDHNYWGIECEPDQYFPPCNSIALLAEKVYDLNYGTDYEETVAKPTAEFIRRKLVDPDTGFTMFRYHPIHDYAEPYISCDQAWTLSTFNYFSREQCAKGLESTKRELYADIKGGKECYMKADRRNLGASTDYERSTFTLYGPLLAREHKDVEFYEKVTRFFNDMYGASMEDGVVRFRDAEPSIETHAEGYYFLGAVHLGFEEIFSFDWKAFREKMGR